MRGKIMPEQNDVETKQEVGGCCVPETCNRAACDAPVKAALGGLSPIPSWQIRMIDEWYELKVRHTKLHKMLVKWDAGTLDFTPKCSKELLKDQCKVMRAYLTILEIRAEIEGVSLPQ